MCESCETTIPAMNRRRALKLSGVGAGAAAAAALSWRTGLVFADGTPEAGHAPHWEYEGEEGPEHWGEIDPSYATCSGGTEQSPIDVAGDSDADLANIEFTYAPITPLHIVNNGHTIQVNAPAGSGIMLDGVSYELKQFHFHTPSEHTVGGQGQPMEMHLVHISADGAIAVVGVMLAAGAEHAGLKSVFEAMPVMAGPEQEITGSVDPNELLPETRTTYRYMGSLTTPPCTEGVHWLLMTTPAEVSQAQIDAYRKIFALDARPVQPLNDREIQEDSTP